MNKALQLLEWLKFDWIASLFLSPSLFIFYLVLNISFYIYLETIFSCSMKSRKGFQIIFNVNCIITVQIQRLYQQNFSRRDFEFLKWIQSFSLQVNSMGNNIVHTLVFLKKINNRILWIKWKAVHLLLKNNDNNLGVARGWKCDLHSW